MTLLHGSIACCENELDVRTLVSRMAKAFFGENYYLLTDALMSSKEASRIMKEEKNNQRVFKMFDHVTISVSGIGSFYPTEESVLASPDFMSTEDLEMLKQENVSGDIALRFFDHDGQECNTTLKERMISISMEQFKKIDRKISLVSGVSKANAVLSALKGGLVDVLILDSNLAEALLKLSEDMSSQE